jgi:hypothetical protein
MSNDDLSTVNFKKDKVAKEFEVLRQRYEEHRRALEKLIVESPTESLAGRYADVLMEIDSAILKLQELERGSAEPAPASRPVPPLPGTAGRTPTLPGLSPAANHPLRRGGEENPPEGTPADRTRTMLIVFSGVALLALLGWLAWNFLSGNDEAAPATATAPAVVEQAPAPEPETLEIDPAELDYGVVRKGTRVAKSFAIRNNGATPLTLDIPRSACRCLWFDFNGPVPANGTLQLGVIVDGARAKSGQLEESMTIGTKENPEAKATFTVDATIQ